MDVSLLQKANRHLAMVQMRLGMFDDPTTLPWANLGPDDVCTDESLAIAHETARQGIVLLKNTNHQLPMDMSTIGTQKIALIGPNADSQVFLCLLVTSLSYIFVYVLRIWF